MSNDVKKLEQIAYSELERSVQLEKAVEESSAFNVKEPALALARSQRKLLAVLCKIVFQSGHHLTKGEKNG